MPSLSGSCLCSEIGFQIELPAIFLNHCHCSRCRKASGSAFGSYLHVAKDRFHWVRGLERIVNYVPQKGDPRPFCSTCGSRVPLIEEDGVIVPAGSLDGDPQLKPCVSIHIDSKASWYEISEMPPSFANNPPGSFWEPIEREYQEKLAGSTHQE